MKSGRRRDGAVQKRSSLLWSKSSRNLQRSCVSPCLTVNLLMNKLIFGALIFAPLLLLGCKKNKITPPLEGQFYEVAPVNGGSTITFHNDFSFTLQNLRISSIGIIEYKYTVSTLDSRLNMIPPAYDSYPNPGPVSYRYISPNELQIDNFRPNLWGQTTTITFKRK